MKVAMGPGFREKLVSALSDNPLTQSFQRTMGGLIDPLEARNDVYKNIDPDRAAYMAKEMMRTGDVDALKVFLMEKGMPESQAVAMLTNPSVVEGAVNQAIAELQGKPTSAPQGLHNARALIAALHDPSGQYGKTPLGDRVRSVLGHPVAAYSAVGAGGALGTQALLDLVAYLNEEGAPEGTPL